MTASIPAGDPPADSATVTAALTFIGNATMLLELGRFRLLTDPAFGGAGSRVPLGYGAWTRRLTAPALQPAALPALDAVLLSHLHGDHFDPTAQRALDHTLPIITTPQAANTLRRRGFRAATGIPTWTAHRFVEGDQELSITAVPGRHGPGFADRLLPDVMGSVLELKVAGRCVLRLYITGDTLCRPMLADIPSRCGPIDVMVIHLGGTRLLGMLLTMDAAQGIAATEMIGAGTTIPIHYDDYRVFTSPLSDYLVGARNRGLTGIRSVIRGDTVPLPVRTELDPSHP